ncbi:hypothetical protein PHLCEN_2v9330 [Hermanssonia centrifuga]|uniref:Uncharacterized protein n=1 Tax=Hermanssonia centrifuga TaxID=98765 RepID=A0A2R6NR60_9APHY|nr:hypothetical protein PHLCEN_2v9330 [Hermanssonia centrifuga]
MTAPKSESETKAEKGRVKQTLLPLPPDVDNALEVWQQKFVPTYLSFIGSLKSPWDGNSTKREINKLQKIWSAVFPTSNKVVTDGGIIHKVCGYRYRNNMTKIAAIAILKEWEMAGITTKDNCIAYIQANLELDFKCMMSDPENLCGMFESSVILKTFAIHLSSTAGAVIQYGNPVGGLALAAAAVEHGFVLWKTGHILCKNKLAARIKICTTEDKRKQAKKSNAWLIYFSQATWGRTTRQYMRSTKNLTKKMWKAIIFKTQVYKKAAESAFKYRDFCLVTKTSGLR